MKVSYYNDAKDIKSKDYNLEDWLLSTINPSEKLKKEVEKYRETLQRKDKIVLPCVSISASFKGDRNLNNIGSKNPLICIDVDRKSKDKKKKSNLCIDFQLAKEMFKQHPCTYFVGNSSSGVHGIYAIIKLEKNDELEYYFKYFQKMLAHSGINIDESCVDYTRVRFFSYDPEAYFNPQCKALSSVKHLFEDEVAGSETKKETKVNHQYTPSKDRALEMFDNRDKVEKCLTQIEQYRIDITSSYEDWIRIGSALYNEFGEDGKSLFHRCSKFHPDYNEKSCDLKWNNCKKMRMCTIATFYKVCADYGIRYLT